MLVKCYTIHGMLAICTRVESCFHVASCLDSQLQSKSHSPGRDVHVPAQSCSSMMSTTDLGFQSGYSKLSTSRSSLRLTNPSPLAQVNRNLLTPSPGSFRTFSSSSSTGTYVLLIFLPVRASYSSTIALRDCGGKWSAIKRWYTRTGI